MGRDSFLCFTVDKTSTNGLKTPRRGLNVVAPVSFDARLSENLLTCLCQRRQSTSGAKNPSGRENICSPMLLVGDWCCSCH